MGDIECFYQKHYLWKGLLMDFLDEAEECSVFIQDEDI